MHDEEENRANLQLSSKKEAEDRDDLNIENSEQVNNNCCKHIYIK